jgi:hypothetical protein
MNVTVNVTVPRGDSRAFNAEVLDPAGGVAAPGDCTTSGGLGGRAAYHGNGAYTVVVRYFSDSGCTRAAGERRYQYAISAGSGVTPPPGKLLTRPRNSTLTTTHALGFTLNPGAASYEIRFKRNGVIQPDGSIGGTTKLALVNPTTGLAGFGFVKPGRYVIVARAQNDGFFTGWSAPTVVNAIAPFDLRSVTYPDRTGPSYKLKGQIREHSARGKVTIYLAKGKKKGKFHRVGKAKINKKGRFTKRFTARRTGFYRLRYVYKGNSMVAAGRVTGLVEFRRGFFF